MEEIWKDIDGLNGQYQVSNTGKVRRINKDPRCAKFKELKLQVNRYGYKYAHPKKSFRKTVHQIVAMAFIPNPKNYLEVNHIDCNKINNNYLNLEWCNRSQNSKHASDNNLLNRMNWSVTEDSTGKVFNSIKEVSLKLNIGYGSFASQLKKYKTYKGYTLGEKIYGKLS